MPGKERHDADDTVVHNQRVAGKRHHPFSPRPFLIAHFGIADDGVGQVRLAILRDAPNLELSDRDPSMRAVQMRVEARARLQLEHAFAFVEGPDSGKGGPEMRDERLGALLQGMGERVGVGQRQSDGRAQRRQLRALADLLLGAFAFGDVLLDVDEVLDLALRVAHRRDGLFLCVEAAVLAAIDHFAAPDLPGQNRVPQILVERLIVSIRLDQVPRVPADGFCVGIAGQFGKCRVDPFNEACAIGNDHGVGRGVQGGALQAQLRFRLVPLGDVRAGAERARRSVLRRLAEMRSATRSAARRRPW